MTNNLDIFKNLKNKNTKRLKIYKNLFKLVDKDFKYLKKDVLKAYIQENKQNLYTLYNSKRGTGEISNKKDIIPNLIKNAIKKLKKHYGGTDLSNIVAALGSSTTQLNEPAPAAAAPSPTPSPTPSPVAAPSPTTENRLDIINKLVENLKLLKSEKILDKEDITNIIDALKTGQEENPYKINTLITEIFEGFAENMPQWYLVQEYSKDFDSFKELITSLKIEQQIKAADQEAELRVALAMAKLGALFTPSAPMGPSQKIHEREEKFAAAAISDSGLIVPLNQLDAPPIQTNKQGGAQDIAASKSSEDKEKDAANKIKEQNEELSKTKKDANELSQIISQVLSEYNKSYSFEADDLNPTVESVFVQNKEDELKRILTNGELSNDERSLVSKWASIKEEQKWIDGLGAKITKAKELYETVQKSITKLASGVPNDPELAEVLHKLAILNDGAIDNNDTDDTNYTKYSLPTYLSNILNEINAAYKLVYKGYNNAGEAVTKRLNTPQAQNGQSSSLSEQTKQLNNSKTALLTKIGIKIKDNSAKLEIINKDNQKIDNIDNLLTNIKTNLTTLNPANTDLTALNTPDKALTALNTKLEEIRTIIKNISIPQTGSNVRPSENDIILNTKANDDLNTYTTKINSISDIVIEYKKGQEITKGTNTIQNHIKNIQEKVDKTIIREMIRVLDMKAKTRLSPEYGILNDNPTLLDDIYNRYLKSKASDGNLLAAINLENMLNANNLIPSEVLKITTFDKMIFAFIIILFRLVAVTIVDYMIGKGWILSLANTIIAIGVIYTILFIAFVMIVNFDLWRLRILFNYVNLHVNTSIILTHLAIVWGFFGIILLLIYNINFGISGLDTSITTEEDKAKLQYRIEMITALIWVVILLLVAVF